MSSTRYAPEGSAPAQYGYAASAEYRELRGLCGTMVAAKAAITADERHRQLLYWLQAKSLEPGGLKKLATDLLEAFPERLGTPEMHEEGIRAGKVYSEAVSFRIHHELWSNAVFGGCDGDVERSVDSLLAHCRQLAERGNTSENHPSIQDFLIALCVNPETRLYAKEDVRDRRGLNPSLRYFRDVIPALLEFQDREAARERETFVLTSLASEVFATLDFCLRTRKMVVLEGNSRIGKTTAAEAWHAMHRGESRFLSLSGLTNKTTFFRGLARCLGLPSAHALSPVKIQARCEDMLQQSGLLLIIDEAHHLFGNAERIKRRPELVDWINTALFNHRVPVAMIGTPQFSSRRRDVERQTGWNSEQLVGRIKRFKVLPEKPATADLELVARKLLPRASGAVVKQIVGYALASRRYMPAIGDVIDEARLLAENDGRIEIMYEDVKRAVEEFRIPSDLAQARAFDNPKQRQRGGGKRSAVAPDSASSSRADSAISPTESDEDEPPERFAGELAQATCGRRNAPPDSLVTNA